MLDQGHGVVLWRGRSAEELVGVLQKASRTLTRLADRMEAWRAVEG